MIKYSSNNKITEKQTNTTEQTTLLFSGKSVRRLMKALIPWNGFKCFAANWENSLKWNVFCSAMRVVYKITENWDFAEIKLYRF